MNTFCQSCGMPLDTNDVRGTSTDQSLSEDYCIHCFKDGKFTMDCTMEQMIEHCAQFVDLFNEGAEKKVTKEEAIIGMKEYFPTLKRWAKI